MTPPRYGRGEGLYCRDDGENSRASEESGAGRESSRPHITSRLDWAMRGERARMREEKKRERKERGVQEREGTKREEEDQKKGPKGVCQADQERKNQESKWQNYIGMRSWGREGKPMSWRSLGEGL